MAGRVKSFFDHIILLVWHKDMLFVGLFFRLCCFSLILFSYDGNPCSRKKLICRQVESLWDSTQKRMRVRSSCVSLQTCLVNKCYPYSITNIHFIQEVCHQTFMCQCLYTLASLTLQGCRAAGLDFSEGASSAATSLVVHVKIVWHLWGTASSVDSIVWSYFDSLENCHKGLLSGDSGHVGAEEPAWSLLELGCRRPRGRASKQGCC